MNAHEVVDITNHLQPILEVNAIRMNICQRIVPVIGADYLEKAEGRKVVGILREVEGHEKDRRAAIWHEKLEEEMFVGKGSEFRIAMQNSERKKKFNFLLAQVITLSDDEHVRFFTAKSDRRIGQGEELLTFVTLPTPVPVTYLSDKYNTQDFWTMVKQYCREPHDNLSWWRNP